MLELDLAVFHLVNADATTAPALLTAARWISQQLPIAAAGVLLGGLLFGNPGQCRAIALALLSMAIAWIGVQWLRHAVPAPRPAQLGLGMQWIEHAARAGFPSMHVAAASALAASLACRPVAGLGPVAAVVAAVVAAASAALMMWSRVCLGVHFPSDVLAGLLTGVLAAVAAHGAIGLLGRLPGVPPSLQRQAKVRAP